MDFEKPNKTKFTIYSKSGCNYCVKVKKLLEEQMIDFNVIECDKHIQNADDKKFFLSFVNKLANCEIKTFPIVFYKGNFIGGFTDTDKFVHNLIFLEDF